MLHKYCNYTQACTLQNILKNHNVVSFTNLTRLYCESDHRSQTFTNRLLIVETHLLQLSCSHCPYFNHTLIINYKTFCNSLKKFPLQQQLGLDNELNPGNIYVLLNCKGISIKRKAPYLPNSKHILGIGGSSIPTALIIITVLDGKTPLSSCDDKLQRERK